MISNKINDLRKLKKVTEKELSEGIGMSLTGYRQAMRNNDFKISSLQKIANFFGVDITCFFLNKDSKYESSTCIDCPNCKIKNSIIASKDEIINNQERLIKQMQIFIDSVKRNNQE